MQWATGPGSFVVVGLIESGAFDGADALKKTLKKNKKLLEKAATEATPEQQKQTKEAEGQKGGKKGKKEKPIGNVGSKILLEAI